jgi:histidine--tRNA ligase
MKTTTPRIPSGFSEYLPGDQIEFNRLRDIIRETYERYGYAPLDTPDIELSEVLLAKGGGETEKQIYRFERGKNDLSLRFDLTVPLARYVAEHEGQLVFPFRRYQIGKVHRAERAQAGRFREFYQCDIDVIGSESVAADAEFPAVINDIFEQFAFGKFTIHINNRLVLNGFFAGIGLADVSADVLRVVDKIEKISRQDFMAELRELGLSEKQVAQVFAFTEISGSNDEILSQLESMKNEIDSDDFALGTAKLYELLAMLRNMGLPEQRIQLDLRIARGLDYYTGIVYETTLDDYPEVGSVCSGGRYDNLAENYTRTRLPGVGVSIGLSRLFYKLREAGVVSSHRRTLARCMVASFDDAQFGEALQIAAELRRAGVATILNTESVPLKKKLRYADRLGIPLVVLIGEEEVRGRFATVKDMATGENKPIPRQQLVEELQR